MNRTCGSPGARCTLCCKLLPVHDGALVDGEDHGFHKPAGQRCPHQSSHKGCRVYHKPGFPIACAMWTCRWLVDPGTSAMSRPDRTHYVIDIAPDVITLHDNETGEVTAIEVIQVWVDPDHRNAWMDEHLLAYLDKQGETGRAAIIRFASDEAFTLFPPSMAKDGKWHAEHGTMEPQRDIEQQFELLAQARGLK